MIDILIKKKRQTFFDASFFVIVVEVRVFGKEATDDKVSIDPAWPKFS